MSKKKVVFQPGYPLDSFLDSGTTDDETRCPRCGSGKISLPVTTTSGQQIGVCRACAANYIVDQPPWLVTCSIFPLESPDSESARWAITKIFCHTLASAEAYYDQIVAWRGIRAVQLWERGQILKEVSGP